MTRKGYRSAHGMALVTVLVFCSTLLLLGTALLTYSIHEKLIADYQEEEVRLYYIAEAGLEAGLAALRLDFFHQAQITGALNGGAFTVNFATPATGIRSITSEGALGRYRKTVALNAALELPAGCQSLTAEDFYLSDAAVYGDLRVNGQLWAEQGASLISGDLYYRDGLLPIVVPGATLEVTGSAAAAEPLALPRINFELLAGRASGVIPAGRIRQPPAEYPTRTHFLVEGDLEIAPQAGDTFDFSGLFYVQGNLKISPAAGSTLLLDGVFAAEGEITLQPNPVLNEADPPRNLILLAGGELIVLPAEGSLPQIGGTQVFYSREAIRLQGGSPGAPLVLQGVLLAPQIRLNNCTLHYGPALLHSCAGQLPGLGTLRLEWIKPWEQ